MDHLAGCFTTTKIVRYTFLTLFHYRKYCRYYGFSSHTGIRKEYKTSMHFFLFHSFRFEFHVELSTVYGKCGSTKTIICYKRVHCNTKFKRETLDTVYVYKIQFACSSSTEVKGIGNIQMYHKNVHGVKEL